MPALARFISEARRRRVFRTGGLYVIAAWVLIQVVSLLLPAFQQSDALLAYAWLAALVGLPLALLFGWYYDLTPAGIRRTPAADDGHVPADPLHLPDYLIIGAVAIVAAVIAAGLFDRARQTGEALTYNVAGVAVLPLTDLTAGGSEAWFSAGMQDALISSLSRIGTFSVVSRRSTLSIDPTLPTRNVGEMLGVRNLIEGSVARDGNRVRIVVQLVDAVRDVQIWGGSFERELTGALGLQNEVARSIAEAVEVRLSDDEAAALSRRPEMDAQTLDDYLRGMYLIHSGSNLDRRKGIEILKETVTRDPDNALLHAGLAIGYAFLGHSPYPEGMYPASRRASAEALRLDDSLAEAHLAVGMFKMYHEYDFRAAENALLRALEINPSLTWAQYQYAWLMELLNDDTRAIPPGEKTVQLDPLNLYMRAWLADQYRDAGMLDKALAMANSTLDLEPGYPVAVRAKALAYVRLGNLPAALDASQSIAGHPLWGYVHGVVLAKAGRTDEAEAILGRIEKETRNVIPLVLLNAALGHDDAMFEWLEVARDVKLPWYPWLITWFPDMAPYRNDPRLRDHAAELVLLEVID